VTGIVVECRFINPHSIIVVEVEEEGGNVEWWHGEFGGETILSRHCGWNKDTVRPGQTVTLVGRARKNGEPYNTMTEQARMMDAQGNEIYRGNFPGEDMAAVSAGYLP